MSRSAGKGSCSAAAAADVFLFADHNSVPKGWLAAPHSSRYNIFWPINCDHVTTFCRDKGRSAGMQADRLTLQGMQGGGLRSLLEQDHVFLLTEQAPYILPSFLPIFLLPLSRLVQQHPYQVHISHVPDTPHYLLCCMTGSGGILKKTLVRRCGGKVGVKNVPIISGTEGKYEIYCLVRKHRLYMGELCVH